MSSATLEQGALRGEVGQAASEVDVDEVLRLETNGDDEEEELDGPDLCENLHHVPVGLAAIVCRSLIFFFSVTRSVSLAPFLNPQLHLQQKTPP